MNTLLIGGAPNTGKTNSVVWCANYLVTHGFIVKKCIDYDGNKISLPKVAKKADCTNDFCAILEGKDRDGEQIRVTLTSRSDYNGAIDFNFDFFKSISCDIYISSIRDIGTERRYAVKKFGFDFTEKHTIEFPLAKMSRRNAKWYKAKNWYDKTVQDMLEYLLSMPPFMI